MLHNNSPTLVEHWVAHSCFFFIWMAMAYKLTSLDEAEPVLHSQGLAASYYTAGNLLLTESSMARDNCGLSKWSLWALLKGWVKSMILLLRRVSRRRRAWRNKLYTGWLVCVHSGWIVASHFQKSPPATYMTQKILSTTGRIKTWLHYIYARSGRESVCVWCRVSDIVIVYLKDPLRFSNEVFYGCGHNIVSVKI